MALLFFNERWRMKPDLGAAWYWFERARKIGCDNILAYLAPFDKYQVSDYTNVRSLVLLLVGFTYCLIFVLC